MFRRNATALHLMLRRQMNTHWAVSCAEGLEGTKAEGERIAVTVNPSAVSQ